MVLVVEAMAKLLQTLLIWLQLQVIRAYLDILLGVYHKVVLSNVKVSFLIVELNGIRADVEVGNLSLSMHVPEYNHYLIV